MSDLKNQIEQLKQQFQKELVEAENLDVLYLKFLSKKHGLVTELLKKLPKLSSKEKKELGPALNKLKNQIEIDIKETKKHKKEQKYKDPLIDLSFPLPAKKTGNYHPTIQTIKEINNFFRYYGYSVIEGPEIETEQNNFRILNLPKGHPATDLQDTLYIDEKKGILLRTHTSSVESSILSEYKPPIRAVSAGKCYRNETLNATNAAFFWQYQGVVVDKNINMQNLKATLQLFHQFLFGEDVELRFRYKYYPEVSPGMGIDMKCRFCNGSGCEACKYRGWLEVLGSGMIHYNTLKTCGIDPNVYTGFAFGMGLDRLVMQKYGINDIRKLYGGLIYK